MTVALSSIRIEATLDASAYVAGANAKAASDAKMVDGGNKVAASLDQTERKLGSSTTALERLTKAVDDNYRSAAQIEKGQRTLQQALDAGGISADEYARRLALVQERYAVHTPAAKAAADATQAVGVAAKFTYTEMEILRSGVINVAQSIGSGASVMGTLQTQALQTAPALGAVTRAIGGLGVVAAAAGVAALVTGFGVLLLRATTNSEQLRQFDLILQGTGRSSLATASNLQATVKQLVDVGVSAKDADDAVRAIARNPTLNPAATSAIATTGLNVGARLGIGDVAGIQKYTEAIAGGLDPTLKLGFALNALTADEATQILEMDRHGQHAAALNRAISDIATSVDDARKKSLTPATEAINSITAAWEHLLDRLSKTSAIQTAQSAIIGMLKEVAAAADGSSTAQKSLMQQSGYLPPPLGNPIGAALGIPSPTTMATWLWNQLPIHQQPGTLSVGGGISGVGLSVSDRVAAAGNQWLNQNAPFPTIGNGVRIAPGAFDPNSIHWYQGSTPAFDATNPWATPLWNSTGATRVGGGYGSGLSTTSGGTAPPAGSTSQVLPDAQKAADATEAYNKLKDAIKDELAVEAQRGSNAQALATYQQTYNDQISRGVDWWIAMDRAETAMQGVRDRTSIQLKKAAEDQDLNTQLVMKTATAYGVDEVQGLQAAADAQAKLKAQTEPALNVEQERQRLLRAGAAEAINATAQALPALRQQLTASQNLADETGKGTAAAHEAALQNEVTSQTHNLLAKAMAAGIPVSDGLVKSLRDQTDQLVHLNDAAVQAKAINENINQRNDQIAVLGLQTSLVGGNPEQVQAATALLQEQIRLRNLGSSVSADTAKSDLASVTALNQANIAYAEANRQQQRLEDGVRSMADTVTSTLGQAVTDAFSGQKVTDWGTRLLQFLGQAVSQVAQMAFIRPAIGTALSALGFGNLATQFGSFSSLLGGGSSSTASGSITLTPNGSGGFSISNLASGASLLNGGSGGLFGSINSWGASTGLFSSPSVGGLTAAEMSDLGIGGVTTGALGTTLTGFLGAAGAGFGAGAVLNSLLGGNTLYGTVGSGAGSLAGAAIGSLLFPGVGTLLGGLLGGAGGGVLGGLFGRPYGSDKASGGNVDLTTGRITGTYGGDQATISAAQQLSQFTQTLLQATGGTLNGNIGLNTGVNTGLTINGNLGSLSGSYNFGKNADLSSIVPQIELYLAQNLQGVTGTIKQIISTITDPSQIQSAVQFAAVYDNLKKAADSAFSSISSDTQAEGPFAQALDQINQTFASITQQAQQYGLALDPVTASLNEAVARLKTDFNKNISDLMLAITDPVKLAINQEKEAGKQRVADAQAIGADITQVNRLNAATLDQIWTQQTQSLQQLSDSLKTGSLSGLTTSAQLSAANDNFSRELGLVRGGNLGEIANLATAGGNAVQLSQTAYGNGPQTAALRNTIATAVDDVLSHRSFASGTNYTPAGMIRVGERGPEWFYQPGGATVFPNGTSPMSGGSGNKDIVRLLGTIASYVAGGNRISQAVGVEQVNQLKGVRAAAEKQAAPPYQRRRVA